MLFPLSRRRRPLEDPSTWERGHPVRSLRASLGASAGGSKPLSAAKGSAPGVDSSDTCWAADSSRLRPLENTHGTRRPQRTFRGTVWRSSISGVASGRAPSPGSGRDDRRHPARRPDFRQPARPSRNRVSPARLGSPAQDPQPRYSRSLCRPILAQRRRLAPRDPGI